MFLELNLLNTKNEIEFNYEVLADQELDKRIHGLKDAYVSGRIYIDGADEIILECNFSGIMLIEDSISLELVEYEFNIEIEENIEETKEIYEGCYDFKKNILDLKKILWQNIVLEVPISYTEVKDAVLKGNGWELRNEDKIVDEIDPRLKKLEDLLKGDD